MPDRPPRLPLRINGKSGGSLEPVSLWRRRPWHGSVKSGTASSPRGRCGRPRPGLPESFHPELKNDDRGWRVEFSSTGQKAGVGREGGIVARVGHDERPPSAGGDAGVHTQPGRSRVRSVGTGRRHPRPDGQRRPDGPSGSIYGTPGHCLSVPILRGRTVGGTAFLRALLVHAAKLTRHSRHVLQRHLVHRRRPVATAPRRAQRDREPDRATSTAASAPPRSERWVQAKDRL